MERYSRQYNLRFFNIPEDSSEDCIKKLQSILSDDLGIETSIENAHRIGGPRADDRADPRPIIAKFIYRPERFCVIQRKRDLKNGVRVSEDLIWEDRQKKKKLKDVMKQAYDEGRNHAFATVICILPVCYMKVDHKLFFSSCTIKLLLKLGFFFILL